MVVAFYINIEDTKTTYSLRTLLRYNKIPHIYYSDLDKIEYNWELIDRIVQEYDRKTQVLKIKFYLR